MSLPQRRVFISRVSREFGKIAEDLRSALQSVNEAGRTQPSFRQETDTDTTLSKVSEYIRQSDMVLALVGEYSGAYPPDVVLDDPIHPAPPAGSVEKNWSHLLPDGFHRLSYTQWEVILARFWKKSLFLHFGKGYAPEQAPPTADDDLPHQQKFILWLKDRGLDRDEFDSGDRLQRCVLLNLWPPHPPPEPRPKHRTALCTIAALGIAAVAALLLIPRPDVATPSDGLAGVPQKLDEIKLQLAANGRGFDPAARDELDRLIAEKIGITVNEFHRRVEAGASSLDPLERIRAFVIKENFDAALVDAALLESAQVEKSRTDQLIEILTLKAQAYDGKFQHDRALTERKKIAALTDKATGPVLWGNVQAMLAYSLQHLGKTQEAERILKDVVELRKSVVGSENPDALEIYTNYATALAAQARFGEAETKYRETLAKMVRVNGLNHRDTLACRMNLGGVLFQQGKFEEAKVEFRRVIAAAGVGLEKGDKVMLGSRTNLANILEKAGKYAEAEAEHRAVLAIRLSLPDIGPRHPDTLGSRNNIGYTLQLQGKNVEAEAEHLEVLDLRKEILGWDHHSTLSSRNNLANAVWAQGRFEEAEPALRAVLEARQRVLGPQHPHTILSHYNIAQCLEAWGDEKHTEGDETRARALWHKALGYALTAQSAADAVLKNHPDRVTYRQKRKDLEAKLNEGNPPFGGLHVGLWVGLGLVLAAMVFWLKRGLARNRTARLAVNTTREVEEMILGHHPAPKTGKPEMKGGVLLLGSLAWETSAREDGIDGKDRETWRRERLDPKDCWMDVPGVPICYGRLSKKNRNGQFTMTLSKAAGAGTAKLAFFREPLCLEAECKLGKTFDTAFREQVRHLAKVEGNENGSHVMISGSGNLWGFVALWVNGDSPHAEFLLQYWRDNFPPPEGYCLDGFGEILAPDLTINHPWPVDLKEVDFCLCTPTEPNVKAWTAKLAAEASKKGQYFNQTRQAGILTADDDRILSLRGTSM